MRKPTNLFGLHFGRLTVIGKEPQRKENKPYKFFWLCLCECGTTKLIDGKYLRNGDTQSCGCRKIDSTKMRFTKHGAKKGRKASRLYSTWQNMLTRCRNKNSGCSQHYLQRGISVTEEWEKFIPFRDWAVSNGYTDDLEIDRIDNNGPYSPENCRWVIHAINVANRNCVPQISAFGEKKSRAEWHRDYRCVVPYTTLVDRLNHEWIAEWAISTPSRMGPHAK